MIRIELATPELLARSKVGTPPWSLRAIVAVAEDDSVIGVAGFYPDSNRLCMFSDLTPAVLADKRLMVRGIRVIREMASRVHVPVHAVADPKIEGSAKLLLHMGFQPLFGDVYAWHS